MADILIHTTVPSLFTHTKSASNLIADTSTENSHTNSIYNSHITRLRNTITKYDTITDDLNSNQIPSNSSLTSDDHAVCIHTSKEIPRTLDDKSISWNSTPLATKLMTHNQREYIRDVPTHSTGSSPSRPLSSVVNSREDVPYAVINRKLSNVDQHNDFPADAIEKHRKQSLFENDRASWSSKLSEEQRKTYTVPLPIPSNMLKPMDRLNTKFVKPTKIERSLPKLIFQDDQVQTEVKFEENTAVNEIENLQDDDELSSSPLFYEQPGLPDLDEDDHHDAIPSTKRVKFSTAPIRVYPTYSPKEYDRRNEDIDPFAATAEYELEKRIEKMDIFTVEIEKGPEGLGLSVLGMGVGADSGIEKLGIFVKCLNPQGVVAKDGRIKIGDQIIEVNEHSLVGVTHAYAKSVLKATSGIVKFLIGREKDLDNSEIPGLIQRSLEMDQERHDISQTLHKYQDDFYKENLLDDETAKEDEKTSHEFEIEILKQCYESLEETLEATEKEKEHYQKLYLQVQNEFKQMQEKYFQAKLLIKELQDREIDILQRQVELNDQQEKRINELMQKVDLLESTVATFAVKTEENAPVQNEDAPELTVVDVQESVLSQVDADFSQNATVTNQYSTVATPTTRFPSASLDKIPAYIDDSDETFPIVASSNKSTEELDRTAEKQSSTRKIYATKNYSRNLPSKHLSTSALGNIANETGFKSTKTDDSKFLAAERADKPDVENKEFHNAKTWTSDQCIQWLTVQSMTSLIPIFIDRNIDGEKLLSLDSTKMKTMGIKSSREREQLKSKIKELKQGECIRSRERTFSPPSSFQRSINIGNRLRSSSLTKLRERKIFGNLGGK